MTPKIPPMRLMSLDHEPKMGCCAISSNYGPWWDYIAMSFGSWASASFLWIWTLLGFKIDSPKIHYSIDVVQVANEMKSCGVKSLSSTSCYQYPWGIIFFLHRIIERSCNLSKFTFVVSDHIILFGLEHQQPNICAKYPSKVLHELAQLV